MTSQFEKFKARNESQMKTTGFVNEHENLNTSPKEVGPTKNDIWKKLMGPMSG